MNIDSILVVDDSEADQLITELTIQKYDASITIHKAYDGHEALDFLSTCKKHPTLIILDINMPAMNGFEFLEEYEKKDYTSAVVAMLSSSDQARDREKAASFNVVKKYIVKPLTVEDLKEIIALLK